VILAFLYFNSQVDLIGDFGLLFLYFSKNNQTELLGKSVVDLMEMIILHLLFFQNLVDLVILYFYGLNYLICFLCLKFESC
jgi:hypothetical protein